MCLCEVQLRVHLQTSVIHESRHESRHITRTISEAPPCKGSWVKCIAMLYALYDCTKDCCLCRKCAEVCMVLTACSVSGWNYGDSLEETACGTNDLLSSDALVRVCFFRPHSWIEYKLDVCSTLRWWVSVIFENSISWNLESTSLYLYLRFFFFVI